MNDETVIEWLLESDPSIRWQVMHDIVGAENEVVVRERQKVATEGWGAKLLSFQDPVGRWGGQLYNNKWLSTTYSLLLLRQMGLETSNHQAQLACKELLEGGFRANGGISYAKSIDIIDNGVTGMVLSMLAYFGYPDNRVHNIVDYLFSQQLPDGHWEPVQGQQDTQTKFIFDGTLLVLEGLHEYEKQYAYKAKRVAESQRRGRDFLLCHKLYKGDQTDEVVDKKMLRFSFPPRWHYDILAALDYFQDCQVEKDERLCEAIEILKAKRGHNGSWILQNNHAGKTYFDMEVVGKPSKWNTLRALRVLQWWECH
jgi:hypothetical protein